MKTWAIHWHSAEIYGTQASLVIADVPWWSVALEHLAEWFDTHILRHRWCCPREWTFKVPTYSLKRDDDGYLDHSLGGALYVSFCKASFFSYNRETNRMKVPLSDQWLEENNQKWDPLGDEEDD